MELYYGAQRQLRGFLAVEHGQAGMHTATRRFCLYSRQLGKTARHVSCRPEMRF